MAKRDQKTYVSEFEHGKRKPPPTPSTFPNLAQRPNGPSKLEIAGTSVTSSLVRENHRTHGRLGTKDVASHFAGQPDDLK